MFDENSSANVCADVCNKIKIKAIRGRCTKKEVQNNAAAVKTIENSTLLKLFRSVANSFRYQV